MSQLLWCLAAVIEVVGVLVFGLAIRRAKIHAQQLERLDARTLAPMGAKHVLQPTGQGLKVWRLASDPGDTGQDTLVGCLTPEQVLVMIKLLTINPTFIDRQTSKGSTNDRTDKRYQG